VGTCGAAGYTDATKLVKLGTRYYDPNLGRWTQQDPIEGSIASPSTVNRLAYVGNDPLIDSRRVPIG
jgi:RHS repeat-associated protein